MLSFFKSFILLSVTLTSFYGWALPSNWKRELHNFSVSVSLIEFKLCTVLKYKDEIMPVMLLLIWVYTQGKYCTHFLPGPICWIWPGHSRKKTFQLSSDCSRRDLTVHTSLVDHTLFYSHRGIKTKLPVAFSSSVLIQSRLDIACLLHLWTRSWVCHVL